MDYQLNGKIATICIDDGKANAVDQNFIDALNGYLDKAEEEASAVIVSGRPGMFCAGFNLKVIQQGPEQAQQLMEHGMAILTRLYEFPLPLIAASEGHAIGLGAFLLMVCDNRIAVDSDCTISLPETAIGMSFPPVLLTLVHERLSNRYKTLAMLQSTNFSPAEAVAAGFVDSVVAAEQLMPEAIATAEKLAELPADFYALNKRELRKQALQAMHDSL